METIGNFKDVGKRNDGAVYATDQVTNAKEISDLVDTLVKKFVGKPKSIYILTGTHGTADGNLVDEKEFALEDRIKELQYVKAVDVGPNFSSNRWNEYFDKTKAIIILAWCYSGKWKQLPNHIK